MGIIRGTSTVVLRVESWAVPRGRQSTEEVVLAARNGNNIEPNLVCGLLGVGSPLPRRPVYLHCLRR